MKKVAVTQPYLFPYIGYFQIMSAVDEYVFFDDVQYIVRGWINRNNILVNNQKKLFTISLSGASANKLIKDIDILDDFVNFRKTLSFAYAKAPHKEQVMRLIDEICSYPDKNLSKFTANSLVKIGEYLNLRPKYTFSSDVEKNNDLKGQHKIIEVCKKLEADTYINTYGGQELYDKKEFEKENMTLKFLKPRPISYKQFGNDFEPYLSIIDIMMFNTPEEISKILQEYDLFEGSL